MLAVVVDQRPQYMKGVCRQWLRVKRAAAYSQNTEYHWSVSTGKAGSSVASVRGKWKCQWVPLLVCE